MEESTKLVDESTEALWYVVHTYSGYENKVANDLQTMVENRHLQDLICDIKVPVEMVPEIDKNGKQKTAYEISRCDWSSDVCSSDLQYFFISRRSGLFFLFFVVL